MLANVTGDAGGEAQLFTVGVAAPPLPFSKNVFSYSKYQLTLYAPQYNAHPSGPAHQTKEKNNYYVIWSNIDGAGN